ncbi:MAG: DNA (cytosine-5)-methyltransferase 1 [Saliniramus fredricksonii]|uniref:DNA (cytosine-5-)-methyltransferase n=1 Tax=Saliniramus fredricksonii TaxID=1653334 RepID=A0A0P7XTK8_9HYPH|nr:MAG: DNA (cytosine-5)-methyltransferase 1 [Saliniramus fredricksonii]SCC81093.1 DNA (cytosine-5)-methyltransferase 1 [Saliniramus fredricksonii]
MVYRNPTGEIGMRTKLRKSIELFAGAGGLGIGLAQAGFEPQIAVENDKWCCDTLRNNHKILGVNCEIENTSSGIIENDIRNIDFCEFENVVDLVSGGPPCQPFSLAGRHRAYEDARDLFPEAVRAVRESRPKAFIFENVKGLTRSKFSDYFSYIQLQLEHPEIMTNNDEDWHDHFKRLQQHHTSSSRFGLHYNVVTKVLNAANFGIPQKRERVIFVGFRDDINARWSCDDGPFTEESMVWDQVFGSYWEKHEIPKKDRILNYRSLLIAKRLSRDEKPKTLPWRTIRDAISDLPNPEYENNIRFPDHRLQSGARSYAGHTGSYIDEPSKTLKAGVHGVPGGENMIRWANGSVRYFTVRESARIQTFPDNFKFYGAWSECMRQLGNAVPVALASCVGESVNLRLTSTEI